MRIPLEDGGTILFEAAPVISEGPVKAGRVSEVIQDLPSSLRSVLAPVREASRAVLEQLRQAGPDEIEVEFGVDLATQAGAVITKSEASCHLKVTLRWASGDADQVTG
ncbi:CU044_2847 family protein [Streptosporangium carneum]|uniref:CU044_2847 family protein n=1 Tax=Streptosporangium carneum TaxID=47481 RepID=UPI0022F2A7DC|nr:CU044_2847 family protein [Streptosporangium carneum]